MAPTEILASNIFLSARRILAPGEIHADSHQRLEAGGESRRPRTNRTGEARLVIGTHALIEDEVEFARLGFVAIDDSIASACCSRKRLMDKAAKTGFAPHVLVLTATPIPRTLFATLYGDLTFCARRTAAAARPSKRA